VTHPNRQAFIETAAVIDAIDQEIADSNERKKEIYADLKEEIAAADFRALKEAIKLRRKRRADKDGCERHDERVWAILDILEATEQPSTRETPPAATASPGNGIPEETAPTRAPAHVHEAEDLPPHDPETGELIADGPTIVPRPLIVGEIDLTLPSFLDRRRVVRAQNQFSETEPMQ
jgi:uncharacterized protein (UPF0335 family)